MGSSHIPVPKEETVTTPFITSPRAKTVTPNCTLLASFNDKMEKCTLFIKRKVISKQKQIYNRKLQVVFSICVLLYTL